MTAEELRRLRDHAGMTQRELADCIKWSLSSIRGWEQGRNPIPERAARVIRRLLQTVPTA